MDVFSFADKLLAPDSKATATRVPLQCILEITRRCNLRCNHCYIGDARWKPDPGQMPTEKVLRLIDTLAREGTLWLTITGGEPLAHRDFRKIWRHAFEAGFLLHLYTNATLLDADEAGFLREFPPGRIEVSFYGATRETYER
ncbi:MAG: radical SAM protein, partial [Bdellovibrionales bacterium]|nr:radical SAM protein [Bdellovibrionales bacterium]